MATLKVRFTLSDPMDYTALIAWWRANDVELLPPATDDEVREAFRKLGHPVSRDVIELYTQVGGFVDYSCDICWSFSSLARLVEDNNVGGPLCSFADWLIGSHDYRFMYESEETSAVYIEWGNEEHPPIRVGIPCRSSSRNTAALPARCTPTATPAAPFAEAQLP
jgi:hypothetical protein